MKSNLSDIASVAEITAAIGVVISLIFVGLQINEGNRETRAATSQSMFDSELFLAKTYVEHAETWEKILNGVALDEGAEQRKGINLYNMGLMESENRYNQFLSGYIDSEDWEATLEGLKPLRDLPMYEIWRPSGGAANRSEEFRELFHNL
jgi:hypothetical protein